MLLGDGRNSVGAYNGAVVATTLTPIRHEGQSATGAMVPNCIVAFQGSATLRDTGFPKRELRDELRRIPSARNVVAVLSTWAQSLGMLLLVGEVVHRTGQWWLWAPAFFLMGRANAMFGILSHEAAHRVMFRRRAFNDWVGKWLCGAPGFSSNAAYRRVHMAHHRDEFGPDEPDLGLYGGYPITRASFWRKMRRDAFGESGYKNLKGFLGGLRRRVSRRSTIDILAVQALIAAVLTWRVGWWAYPVLWFGPWMTVWRVLNRLRAIAEHGGMQRSDDKRATTHHVRQHLLARFLFTPYNVGYHLAHHVDSGVPMWHLPALNTELEAAGYISPDITYPNYRSLWRALRARPT